MTTPVAEPPVNERRYACPRCGESVLEIALQCYVCRADLLVSLEVTSPIEDQRQVYELAKALNARFPTLPFATLRSALQGRERVVAPNVTRSVAGWIGAELERHGVRTAVQPNATPFEPAPRAIYPRAIMAALAVLLAAGGAITFQPWRSWDIGGTKPASPGVVATTVPDLPAVPGDARALAARVVPATATVRCGSSQGSGFFVAPNRVVTNAHVLCEPREGSPEVILERGQRLAAKVLRRDERLDAAVLEVAGANVTPLSIGDATTLQRGDKVYVVGAPLGMEFTMSQGIVAHAKRRAFGLTYVQIDLSVTHGNSGGPLIDDQSRVVGLVTLKVGTDATIGLALAVNHLYTGPDALIAAPSTHDAAAWNAEQQLAATESLKERDKVRAELRRPLLLRSRYDGQRYHAAIGYTGDGRPPGKVNLELKPSAGGVCAPFVARTGQWRVIPTKEADLPPTLKTWVRETHGKPQMQLGIASFAPTGCMQAVLGSTEFVLKGGMPGFDRLTVD